MRITTKHSAYRHGITDAEIRTVITYPALRVALVPRLVGSAPVLHIGNAATDEPDLEVIADMADPAIAVVFHAMFLRPALVASLGLTNYIEPNYGPQRS